MNKNNLNVNQQQGGGQNGVEGDGHGGSGQVESVITDGVEKVRVLIYREVNVFK